MDKKVFRSGLLLIAFAAIMIMAVMKIDSIGMAVSGLIGILTPFFIGFVIAFVLNIPYKAIYHTLLPRIRSKRGIRLLKPVSICGAYVLCLAIVGAIFSFIIPEMMNSVKMLMSNIGTYAANLEHLLYTIGERIQVWEIDPSALEQQVKRMMTSLDNVVYGTMTQIFSFTAGIFQSLFNLLIGIILSIYMLSSRDKLKTQAKQLLYAFAPTKIADKTMEIGRLTAECFARFISGQLTEACVLGGLCFIGMTILQFPYAFLISVMIGATSIIPVVGAFLGAIPAVFLLLMVEPMKALWFMIFLVILQQIEGNLIYPKVVGESIGLPAIWVMLAILLGGGFGGAMGMLLGVPMMTVVYKLLTKESDVRIKHKKIDIKKV